MNPAIAVQIRVGSRICSTNCWGTRWNLSIGRTLTLSSISREPPPSPSSYYYNYNCFYYYYYCSCTCACTCARSCTFARFITVQQSRAHLFDVFFLCWGRGGGRRTGLGFPGRLVVWMLLLVKTLLELGPGFLRDSGVPRCLSWSQQVVQNKMPQPRIELGTSRSSV